METSRILDSALDEILSEYEKEHLFFFENDSARRAFYYGHIARKLKSWNGRRQCIYRNCTNKSIRRSHSIQKSGQLVEIATSSRVLTPEFNKKIGELELVEKGLAQASIFPGFCQEHEVLFWSFENGKSMASEEGNPPANLSLDLQGDRAGTPRGQVYEEDDFGV